MISKHAIFFAAALTMISCQGLLPGCQPDEPDKPQPDDTDTCGVGIDETWPTDGTSDLYYRSDIEFYLSDPDPDGTPTLSLTSGGQLIPGESRLSEDAETVTFTPAAPLQPQAEYTATLNYCQGEASIAFLTSELGAPLEVDLEGRTYSVSLLGGRVVEPPGFGDVIATLIGQPDVLVEVQQADDQLVFLGAIAETNSDEQNLCSPTIDFPPADFSDAPYFEVPPSLVDIEVDGTTLSLHEFTMAGTFAADGGYFGGGVIGGELDTRDLVDLVPEVEDPEEACELMASFGAPCRACTSDDEPLCLRVLIDRLLGDEVHTDVVEVRDPSENPDCP
ncbi:MAG: Ig-like domain-containing protein [Pseudomonadota bacterium]